MGDGPRGIEVFPDHFQASTSGAHPPQTQVFPVIHQRSDFENSLEVVFGLEENLGLLHPC